jgi:hypothetical protein
VTLTAEGGTVEWTASATGVTLTRSFGTVKPGQSVQIKITLTDPYSGWVDFQAKGTPDQRVTLRGV